MERIKNIISKVPIHSRKFLILGAAIVLLVIISTALVLIRASSGSKSKEVPGPQTQSTEKKKYFAALSFSENALTNSTDQPQSVSISIDVGTNSLGSVSFGIRFDPNAISNLSPTQEFDDTSALSHSLTLTERGVSDEKGYANVTLSLKNGAEEQSGRGKIIKVTFTPNSAYKGSTAIELTDIVVSSSKLGADEEFYPQTSSLVIQSQ